MTHLDYIIVSPVRNEARNIERTIASVLAQTRPPLRWIIVDDGSSDGTAELVERAAGSTGLIQLIRMPDRGYYDLMRGGEIKAFLFGLESARDIPWDYLVKIDGDVSFGPSYFEDLLREFARNPRLGVASGACHDPDGTLEESYELHPRGAARAYRRACWDAIGGVARELAWDAVDIYRARMLGWETRAFPNIPFLHHVKTGTKDGILKGRGRGGRVEYLMGMHPLFLASKAVALVPRRPFLIGALAYLYGYARAFARREPRVSDPRLVAHIRREQLARLSAGVRGLLRLSRPGPGRTHR